MVAAPTRVDVTQADADMPIGTRPSESGSWQSYGVVVSPRVFAGSGAFVRRASARTFARFTANGTATHGIVGNDCRHARAWNHCFHSRLDLGWNGRTGSSPYISGSRHGLRISRASDSCFECAVFSLGSFRSKRLRQAARPLASSAGPYFQIGSADEPVTHQESPLPHVAAKHSPEGAGIYSAHSWVKWKFRPTGRKKYTTRIIGNLRALRAAGAAYSACFFSARREA